MNLKIFFVNCVFFLFVGVICDVIGGFEGVFYVVFFVIIFCFCLCIILFIVDKICMRKNFRKDYINKIFVILYFWNKVFFVIFNCMCLFVDRIVVINEVFLINEYLVVY